MKKPVYTAVAINDLEEILVFIARDKPGAAMGWIEKIEAKCVEIANNPEVGEKIEKLGKGVRVSTIGRYMIVHRYLGRRLEILRIVAGGVDLGTK